MASEPGSPGFEEIKRAVADTTMANLRTPRVEATAIAFEALSHSISLIMHNAGSAQYGAQQLELAAVSKTCAEILKAV
jgi:hypothetical protein